MAVLAKSSQCEVCYAYVCLYYHHVGTINYRVYKSCVEQISLIVNTTYVCNYFVLVCHIITSKHFVCPEHVIIIIYIVEALLKDPLAN